MKDENGEFIPKGTAILKDEHIHEIAMDYLDISQTNVDATIELARLMDMTWSDDADGWVDWEDRSFSRIYCSKCGKEQDHSFSSECCGAFAINGRKEMIVNAISQC